MRIFEKILCPVDFSESSIRAVQWTQLLAEKFGSKVIILHVAGIQAGDSKSEEYEAYRASLANKLYEFLLPMRIKHESMLSTGNAAEKIVALAEGLDATLIVMGTTGMQGFAQKMLGSTTEQVVRAANIPVFTVSPNCIPKESKQKGRTLLPLYRTDQSPRDYVRLRKLLRDLGNKVSLMHVVELNDPMFDANFYGNPLLMTNVQTEERKQQLQRIGVKLASYERLAEPIVHYGDPAKEILKEIDSGNYDFVVSAAHKRTFLSRFLESTACEIISKAPVPVITVCLEKK